MLTKKWKLHDEKLADMVNSYSQLIPPTTERAISLAPSSYTCLVAQSPRNTLSITNHTEKKSETPCS